MIDPYLPGPLPPTQPTAAAQDRLAPSADAASSRAQSFDTVYQQARAAGQSTRTPRAVNAGADTKDQAPTRRQEPVSSGEPRSRGRQDADAASSPGESNIANDGAPVKPAGKRPLDPPSDPRAEPKRAALPGKKAANSRAAVPDVSKPTPVAAAAEIAAGRAGTSLPTEGGAVQIQPAIAPQAVTADVRQDTTAAVSAIVSSSEIMDSRPGKSARPGVIIASQSPPGGPGVSGPEPALVGKGAVPGPKAAPMGQASTSRLESVPTAGASTSRPQTSATVPALASELETVLTGRASASGPESAPTAQMPVSGPRNTPTPEPPMTDGVQTLAKGTATEPGLATTVAPEPQPAVTTDTKLNGIERMLTVREPGPGIAQRAGAAGGLRAGAIAGGATPGAQGAATTAGAASPSEVAAVGPNGNPVQPRAVGPVAGPVTLEGAIPGATVAAMDSSAPGSAAGPSVHVAATGALGEHPTDAGTGRGPRDESDRDSRAAGRSSAYTPDLVASPTSFGGGAASESTTSVASTGAQPAAGQNIDRAQIAQQISRHVESMRLSSGHGEMTLNLAPEHLGALRLTVTSDEHGVTARIVVQTAQAQQAVEGAKEHLRTSLENRGLNLTSIDVTLSQSGGDANGAFARQQQRAREAGEFAPLHLSSTPEAMPLAATVRPGIGDRDISMRLDYRA